MSPTCEESVTPVRGAVGQRFLTTLSAVALAVSAVLLVGNRLADSWKYDHLAVDFRQTFLPAAEALVHGHSPYPAYGYPPLVAFLSTPFALLPSPEIFVTLVLLACVPISLLLLDVKDVRCHAAAFLWVAVFNAVQTANITLVMLVAIAGCWRWRDSRPTYGAVAGGLALAMKMIAWPLAVWMAFSGRIREAIRVVAVAIGVTLGLWAVIGFSGLLGYPDSLHHLQAVEGTNGYTVQALAEDLRLSHQLAVLLAVATGLASLAAVVVYARRRQDAQAFASAVVAVIATSPIVWLHSFALLLAVLGVLRPRFSALWLLPAVLWFVSTGTGNGQPWETAATLGVAVAVVVLAFRAPTPAVPAWGVRKPSSPTAFGR
jgi:hypothetical protein